MRKIILLFLLIILALPLAYADTLFNENFEYTGTFTSHGWTRYTTGSPCGNNPTSPENFANLFTGGTLAFGTNLTTQNSCYVELDKFKNFTNASTQQITKLSYSYYLNSQSSQVSNTSVNYNGLQPSCEDRTHYPFYVRMIHKGTLELTSNIPSTCTVDLKNYASNVYNMSNNYTIEYNYQTETATVFVNGLVTNCVDFPVPNANPSNKCINGIVFFLTYNINGGFYGVGFDDIQVTNSSSATGFGDNCTDSDGYNPLVSGQVIYNNASYVDYCENNDVQWEYTCLDNVVDVTSRSCSSYYGADYYCFAGNCIQSIPSSCPYPVLFCDDFNYAYDVSQRGWITGDLGGNSFSLVPSANVLNLTSTTYETITNRLDFFDILYIAGGSYYNILSTEYTPLMSSEFKFYPNGFSILSNSCFFYKGLSNKGAEIYDIAFCANQITKNSSFGMDINYNNTILYKNYSGGEDIIANNWDLLCWDCINPTEENTFKVTAYFKDRGIFQAFHSLNTIDKSFVIINNVGQIPTLSSIAGQAEDTNSLKRFIITKQANSKVAIDDYYIYTGTNRLYDDTQDYFSNVALTIFNQTSIQTTIQLAGTGSPCSTNSECSSSKCENGFCALKLGNEGCNANSQCLSGQCVNLKCTKPSLSQLTRASVKEQFGDDTDSLNIISMFLMIGIPTAMVVASGGAGLMIILGVVVFIILGFFFTVMGWLSPFITLGLLVACLVVVMFVFIIKSRS